MLGAISGICFGIAAYSAWYYHWALRSLMAVGVAGPGARAVSYHGWLAGLQLPSISYLGATLIGVGLVLLIEAAIKLDKVWRSPQPPSQIEGWGEVFQALTGLVLFLVGLWLVATA
jgi:hypothetical protein